MTFDPYLNLKCWQRFVACVSIMINVSFISPEPMHDNGTQTIKAEVVEPIVEAQETCREEANTSSSYSPSPRTVYTCNDGKVSLTGLRDALYSASFSWFPLAGLKLLYFVSSNLFTFLFIIYEPFVWSLWCPLSFSISFNLLNFWHLFLKTKSFIQL